MRLKVEIGHSRRWGKQGLGLVVLFCAAPFARAQTAIDPGVRGLPLGVGSLVSGLTSNQLALAGTLLNNFVELNSVTGSITGNSGLGPRYNSNSCVSCHSFPTTAGSSGIFNPFFFVGTLNGAINTIPSFESLNGAAMNTRFPLNLSNPSLVDGQVHQVFTITGRSDAAGCEIAQPDYSEAQSESDVTFRIPLPLFGDGFIEILQDSSIINNLNSNAALKASLGIGGVANIAPDGSISRFGWKAQNRSLLIFASEAYNVEEGVTNERFPNELDETPGCVLNGVPEDRTNFNQLPPHRFPGDPERFAIFIRFQAAPTPAPSNASTLDGQTQFNNAGCVLCHTQSFTTPALTAIAGLGNKTINPFSDLALHHMGNCLADNVTEGQAQGDMFRTPPLWGVGQRIFFLHDGRTTDIVQAIEDHSDSFCTGSTGNGTYPPSEADAVINNFNALTPTQQQDLVNFLRSL